MTTTTTTRSTTLRTPSKTEATAAPKRASKKVPKRVPRLPASAGDPWGTKAAVIDDMRDLVVERARLVRKRAQLNTQIIDIDNMIKNRLSNAKASVATVEGIVVATWKLQHRKEYVVPASEYRVLRILG